MKKLIVIVISLIALFGFITIGLAGTTTSKHAKELIQGKITYIDKAKNEIVVKDDKTGVEKTVTAKSKVIASLKVGDEVKVTLKGGSNIAESVKVVNKLKK